MLGSLLALLSYGSLSFNDPYMPVSKTPDLRPIRSYLLNLRRRCGPFDQRPQPQNVFFMPFLG